MRNPRIQPPAPTAALLLAALALAPGAARAEDEVEAAIKEQTTPESTVEVGAGAVTNDNSRFGQYTGLRKEGPYGIGNVDINRRDDATGTWMRFFGRDLGYQDREARFEHERQGNWGYFIDFSQTPAYSPYIVNTGLAGIGTRTQTISPIGLSDAQLKTQRDAWTIGGQKFLWNNWSVNLSFKNEEKNGSQLFGRGSSGQEFLAQPINSVTRQAEANLAYAGEKFQFNGGYYGTWFTNRNSELDVFGGTNSSTTSPGSNFQTIALPPSNSSYQLNLAGGYNFTPTSRMSFKVASGRVTQNDAYPSGFFVSPAVPSTVSPASGAPGNLGGRIDTTFAQLGFTARPLDKLTVRADLRYDDRADKTPIFTYFTGTSATSTSNGDNEPRSIKNTVGKVEASYALPMGFRAIGGIDYVQTDRNASDVRIVSTRLRTDETSYRAELRRSVSETVTGSIGYVRSDRGGSDWLLTTLNGGAVGSNLMYPMFLADRVRDKWRAVLDWTPTDPLSFHFVFEDARDHYTSRYVGLNDGSGRTYSADMGYTFAPGWQATAWYTRDDTRSSMTDCQASTTAPSPIPTSQSYCPNTAANTTWDARLRTVGDAFGVGLRGKAGDRWDLGADLQYFRDRSEQLVTVLSPGAAPADSFPDIHYDRITLRMFGTYKIDKSSSLRLQFIHDHFKTDDWTWTNYVYGNGTTPAATDGTTVRQVPIQNVDFIGFSYLYKFQ